MRINGAPNGANGVTKLARQGSSAGAGVAKVFGPVSSHPFFPAITALWFAALFGLCSLAIRPELLESLVKASGIERVIPAAAPPLGMTARALIALALAMAGGLIGIAVSRVVVRDKPAKDQPITRQRKAKADAPRRHPISALEELGEAPAPESFAAPVAVEEAEVSPGLDEPEEQLSPAIDFASLELVRLPEAQPAPVFLPQAEPEITPEPLPVALPPLGKAAQRILAADLDTLTPIELVERLGISMQRRRAGMPAAHVPASFAPPGPLPRLHSAPRVRVNNEQALRSALATLQKISGAA